MQRSPKRRSNNKNSTLDRLAGPVCTVETEVFAKPLPSLNLSTVP